MDLQSTLRDAGFHFSKSLGQNFLSDPSILETLCDQAAVDRTQNILEIGPGAGTLTRALAKRGKFILAVEIDRALEPVLTRMLADCDNVRLLFGDIMRMDIADIAREAFNDAPFMVVANLPYYITTPLLMRLLESAFPPHRICVMVQREVADRIVAQAGTKAYGALSVAVQYRAAARIVMRVPAGAFFPPPKVDSAVVRMDIYADKPVQPIDEALFLRVSRAAFAMRRKTMANNLVSALNIPRTEAESALAQCGFSPMIRGETLSVADLCKLADALSPKDVRIRQENQGDRRIDNKFP